MSKTRSIRGNVLEIGEPTPADRQLIFEAFQNPEIHVALGLKNPPQRPMYDRDMLELHRGDEVKHEPVRYHALRDKADGRFVGFFLDFGWDHANDSVRELDIAFPDPKDRNLGSYFDATILISFYLFENGLAKRVRWRVRGRGERVPKSYERWGARFVSKQTERHPVTGDWMNTFIFEFAIADYNNLVKRVGQDAKTGDYEISRVGIWDLLRTPRD
jgi:RimJ/RimL family protein N-acetyltransferase